MTEWIWRWWWLDPYLQGAVLVSALAGAGFSAYALGRTWGQRQRLRRWHVNGVRQSVLRMHLVTESGIFLCQSILVAVSIGMMTLPPPPVAMYADHQGADILMMLFLRKLARLATSLILLCISAYKVRWMWRVA